MVLSGIPVAVRGTENLEKRPPGWYDGGNHTSTWMLWSCFPSSNTWLRLRREGARVRTTPLMRACYRRFWNPVHRAFSMVATKTEHAGETCRGGDENADLADVFPEGPLVAPARA